MNLLPHPLYSIAPLVDDPDELASPSDFRIVKIAGVLDESHYLISGEIIDGPSFLEWWSCRSPILFTTLEDAQKALAILVHEHPDTVSPDQ